MKIEMQQGGTLYITAESNLESYALRKLCDECRGNPEEMAQKIVFYTPDYKQTGGEES